MDKELLIKLQTEKARRFLSQADQMMGMEIWELAANRYYYACFHAVQALFVKNDINAHSHAAGWCKSIFKCVNIVFVN